MKSAPANHRPRQYIQGARAEAAEATGRRIVDTFLARLMMQWYDEITLDRVAEDAGVTVQTVVRRFGGKEGLLAEAVKILAAQIETRRATPRGDIGLLVKNLIDDYEQTGDGVLRLLALENRHTPIKQFTDIGRRFHREWVSNSFGEALAPLDAPARKRAVDALVIVTDVFTWKLLRRDMGRSVPAATGMLERLIRATIAEFSRPHAQETGSE